MRFDINLTNLTKKQKLNQIMKVCILTEYNFDTIKITKWTDKLSIQWNDKYLIKIIRFFNYLSYRSTFRLALKWYRQFTIKFETSRQIYQLGCFFVQGLLKRYVQYLSSWSTLFILESYILTVSNAMNIFFGQNFSCINRVH